MPLYVEKKSLIPGMFINKTHVTVNNSATIK